jgi:prepilin-type N-terminal cleavage/methylation domain-containing protein
MKRGFTLIEVMVAMVIGAMVVAAAAALLSSLENRAEAIARASARADRDANAERVLRGLLANLDLGRDSTSAFVGTATSARFRTWCDSPTGWLERCAAHLSIEQRGDAAALRLELTGPDPTRIDLASGLHGARFRYLAIVDGVVTWRDTWSHLVVPAAVVLIVERDTLLFPVWGSG